MAAKEVPKDLEAPNGVPPVTVKALPVNDVSEEESFPADDLVGSSTAGSRLG
jgi:hypothetical protein